MSDKPIGEFEKAALAEGRTGLLGEFWHFLRNNKKWWLLPIVVILLLFGLLILLSGTAAAPFINTLF
jgi:drug/metabolite transporter superfamily protein YnfA